MLREAGSSSQNQMQFEPRPETIPRKMRRWSSQRLTQILGAEIDRRSTNRLVASGKENSNRRSTKSAQQPNCGRCSTPDGSRRLSHHSGDSQPLLVHPPHAAANKSHYCIADVRSFSSSDKSSASFVHVAAARRKLARITSLLAWAAFSLHVAALPRQSLILRTRWAASYFWLLLVSGP